MPGLATLPEASAYTARGGGGGARPVDPSVLASRALNAAMGDDQDMALQLYDYGVENYGSDFITAYNSLRDSKELGEASVTPSKPGVLKQVIDTIKVGDDAGLPPEPSGTGYEMKPPSGLPRTAGGKGGIIGAGGLPRSPEVQGPPEAPYIPEPGQPVVAPSGAVPLPVANARPAITVGDASGMPPEPAGTGYEMKPLTGLPRTAGGRGGIAGAGGLPTTGGLPRSPQVQGPPYQGSGVEMERALRDPAYRESIIPTPGQPVVVPGAPQIPVRRPDRDENLTRMGQAGRGSVEEEAVARGVTVAQVEAERAADLEKARAADAAASGKPPASAVPVPEPVPTDTGLRSVDYPARVSAPVPTDTPPGTSVAPPSVSAPVPAEQPGTAREETIVPGSDRPRRLKDGTYVDPPLGPQVMPDGSIRWPDGTTEPGNATTRRMAEEENAPSAAPSTRNLPSRSRPMAAAPNSGGLATTVQAPPAVDTGTNTVTSSSTSTNVSAAPAVDTGTNEPSAKIDEGFMGKPDIWSFLTSAGLGMMSSGSPNFLGSVGAGGKAGIDQLGVLRKDQRERAKALADAQFQRDRIKLGYVGEAGQNSRTDRTIASQEKIATQGQEGQTLRTRESLRSGERNTDVNNEGATDRTILSNQNQLQVTRENNQSAADRQDRQGQINQILKAQEEELRRQGKVVDRDELFKWGTDRGGTEDEVRRAILNITDKTADKPTPMDDKETTLAIEIAATTLLGQGATGPQLLAEVGKLSPELGAKVLKALTTKQESGGGAGAVLDILRANGVTVTPGGWISDPSLKMPRTAPAGASPPAGGGGTHEYIPGKGVVAK